MLCVVGRFNGINVELFTLFCKTSVLKIIKMILVLIMHPRTPVAEGPGTPSRGSFAALCKRARGVLALLALGDGLSRKWKGVDMFSFKHT